ncbi:unnamed protein product [Amoebophrya sp. A25]|nr:unnamed protein product [Amoebophrya sp. A25]|eukprot:GSA25T00001790001.1
MSGGFFIAKKNNSLSREQGMLEMRRAMGLEVPEGEEERASREREEDKIAKTRVRIKEVEDEELAKQKTRKPKKPATILGTLLRPVRMRMKGVDFKHEAKELVKRQILHRKNFRGIQFYLRLTLFLIVLSFYVFYEITSSAAAEYKLAFCKFSGFASACDGPNCSLIVSLRQVEEPEKELYQLGWFPDVQPNSRGEVEFADDHLFGCCPLDSCCGFAKQLNKGANAGPMAQMVWCDSAEYAPGCGPGPWECYFKDNISDFEVTGIKTGRPWAGDELLIIFLVASAMLVLTFYEKIHYFYLFTHRKCNECLENLPSLCFGLLWWLRFLIIQGFMIPATKVIDVVSMIWGIPVLQDRHAQRMAWIVWLSRFARLPEPPSDSESEEELESVTFEDVVEMALANKEKPKYPAMRKQLRPLIKPLEFQWDEKMKVPDEVVKRLRIADAMERDRAMYKPDYLREERHKFDAAFSDLKRSVRGFRPGKVAAQSGLGPDLRPTTYQTPPDSPRDEKTGTFANMLTFSKAQAVAAKASITMDDSSHIAGNTSPTGGEGKDYVAVNMEKADADYGATLKTIPEDRQVTVGGVTPRDNRSEAGGASPGGADSSPTHAPTGGAFASAARTKNRAALANKNKGGFSRPQRRVAVKKAVEDMTPAELAEYETDRERRNKMKRMRGEPTSSDEEKAQLTREIGNLKAAERDAESGSTHALGVLSMMRRTAKKLADRKRKRDASRVVKEQIGLTKVQGEIMRLPFDRRDGPDLRTRTRTDMQILQSTPTLETLQEDHFPTKMDQECYQWRALKFQNRLAPDSTIFRYNPEWHREGKFQPALQQVRGNLVLNKPPLGQYENVEKLKRTLYYFADKREYHAKHVTPDSEHWMKLLDGYKLWMRKSKFFKGFDRKFSPELDFLYKDGAEGDEKADVNINYGTMAASVFKKDTEVPTHIRNTIEKDLGSFPVAALCADELGLLPHRVKDVPTTSRLLVNQARRRGDVALWQNTTLEDRPPGHVRWLAEKRPKKHKSISPERPGTGGSSSSSRRRKKKKENGENVPAMVTLDWTKMLGL